MEFNDNFWKWFKKSKVVDKNRQPKIVYHGSQKKDIEVFEPKRGFNVKAIYFSDNLSVAAHWSGNSSVKRTNKAKDADTVEGLLQILNTYTKAEITEHQLIGDDRGTFYRLHTFGGAADVSSPLGYKIDDNTYELRGKKYDLRDMLREEIWYYAKDANNSGNYGCYLSIQKPLIVDAKKKPYHSIQFNGEEVNTETLVVYAQENGYDGVIVKNVYETDYENILCNDYIVFSPNQIKSIDNNGNWSTNSDNIYETKNKLVKLAEDLDYYADLIEAELEEMSVKTSFDFKPIYMDRKSQELYSNYFVDFITPNFFAVMKETKYRDENSADKFKCSIEFQKGAMSIRDYNPRKAEVFRGMQRTLADMRSANKWLANQIKENFGFVLKGGLTFG